MRHAILIACFLQWGLLSAQDWALLNLDYKYNYTANDAGPIVQQVAVTSNPILGMDSMGFYLAPLSKVCGTCMAGTGGVDAWRYIDTIAPSFLGSMVTEAGDHWHVGPTGEILLEPTADAGSSWTLSEVPPITATASTATWSTVFETNDSIRSIALSNGDEIVISKSFGILHWPASLGTSDGEDLTLAGIHGPDLGWLVPDWTAFFPYQPGDALQYHGYQTIYSSGEYLTTDTKINIIGRTEYIDSIQFQAVVRTHRYGDLSQWQQDIDESSTTTTTWTAGPNTLPVFRILRAGPSRFFNGTTGFTVGHELCGIAECYRNDEGYISVHPKRFDPDGTWTTCVGTTVPGLLALQDEAIRTETGSEQVWYSQGIGLRGYSRISSGGFGENTLELVGAVVADDTIGTLTPDDLFLGIPDAPGQMELSMGPVPADDMLHVKGSSSLGTVQVWDMQGQLLRSRPLSSMHLDLDVSDLAPGVYVLHVVDGQRLRTRAFIIAR